MNEPIEKSAGPLSSIPIEFVCDAFLFQYAKNLRPRIEDYLQAVDESQQFELVNRLLPLDIQQRRRHGEQPQASDYESRFPDHKAAISKFMTAQAEDVPSAESDSGDELTASFAGERAIGDIYDMTVTGRFGDYDLLSKIAHGGMGVVYKARQRNLDRTVAIKMILAGQFANESSVKRFHAEARSAAMLKHPNIVAIYDVGEHDGQHYFSMEYIEGNSLSARVLEAPLSNREAAKYTKQIAGAMQYAHNQGVFHRDLKPSNVLLDSKQRALVTDFGVAKSTGSDGGLTTTGDVIGTPRYMPPEQAAGDLQKMDARSDVYSIGAILYFAVTGRPPFQAASFVETIRQVVEHEPTPLRQINPDVSRDLETISLKCLEKNPVRRYQSAQELADDLDRFLNRRPIQARPVSRLERVAKWARRRPAIAGLVAVSLGAVATIMFMAFRYSGKLQTTNTALETALAGKAEQADHAARQSGIALETLAAVVQKIQYDLQNVVGGQKVRRSLLADSIDRLHKVGDGLKAAPEANHHVASAHIKLGAIYLESGNDLGPAPKEAAEHFNIGLKIAESLVAENKFPDATNAVLAEAHSGLAILAGDTGDVSGSLTHTQKALKFFRARNDVDSLTKSIKEGKFQHQIGGIYESMARYDEAMEEYQQLITSQQALLESVKDDSGTNEIRNHLALANQRIGAVKQMHRKMEEAERYHQTSVDISTTLIENEPDNFRYQIEHAKRLSSLGKAKGELKKTDSARELYSRSFEIFKELQASAPGNPLLQNYLATASQELAEIEIDSGNSARADELLKESIKIVEALANAAPDSYRYQRTLADAHLTAGHMYLRSGDVKATEEAYNASLKIHKFLADRDPANATLQMSVARAYERLGDTYMRSKDVSAAEQAFQKCQALRFDLVQKNPTVACNNRDLSVAYNKLLMMNVQMGNLPAAREAGEKGLVIAEQLAENNPRNVRAQQDVAVSFEYLGNLEMASGNPPEARQKYERCAEIRERLAEQFPDNAEIQDSVSTIYANLCVLNVHLRDFDAALKWATRNLKIKSLITKRDPENARLLNGLCMAHDLMGDVHSGLGNKEKALASIEKQLAIAESLSERAADDLSVQLSLAASYRKLAATKHLLNDMAASKTAYARALQIGEKLVEAAPGYVDHQLLMADIYEGLGYVDAEDEKSEAKWFEKSRDIWSKLSKAMPENPRFKNNLEKLNSIIDEQE